jgi:hypothetical protein
MNETDLETARQVLARCAGHDPWFPNPDPMVVAVWAEQFAQSGLPRERLIRGVFRAYRDNGSGFRPLPKDILAAARAEGGDPASMTDEERRAHEALCDSKAAPDPPEVEAPPPRPAITSPTSRARLVEQFAESHPGLDRAATQRVLAGVPRRPSRDVPVPLPCPDCGSLQWCEHDEDEQQERERASRPPDLGDDPDGDLEGYDGA